MKANIDCNSAKRLPPLWLNQRACWTNTFARYSLWMSEGWLLTVFTRTKSRKW